MNTPSAQRRRLPSARSRRARRGISALEVVMTAGVLLPLAGGLLFLGIDMSKYIYNLISTLVGWPY